MLNKISIKFRMFFYILLTTIVLILISYLSQLTLNQDSDKLQRTTENLKVITASSLVNNVAHKEFTQLLLDTEIGKMDWKDAKLMIEASTERVKNSFNTFNSILNEEEKKSEEVTQLFLDQQTVLDSFIGLSEFYSNNKGTDRVDSVNNFARVSMLNAADDLIITMNSITDKKIENIKLNDSEAVDTSQNIVEKIQIALFIGGFILLVLGLLFTRSIVKPTNNLTQVIRRISEGEFEARTEVVGTDELANLGTAFNGLLDDRAMTLTQIDEEHQELNQSVFSLLSAVAELSEKDLTIRAAVTEDATGPVADALNLLAQETSDTLTKVKNVAANVNEASNKVNSHLMSINKLAMKEQERAIDTADQMNIMIQKLDSISNSAANTNVMASTTTLSTKKAHESVTDTLSGMSDIRTTVQETGKKIKQLGERSQEISHVIEIIETIAERTTLLALNASMQAAAAGDEGKGFSVIAEEIQRLAESSRESTGQISTLVRNIQQETNTTIETMDKTIEQVIDGSVKAADAADQMQDVLKTTSELVGAVDQIATASKDQVDISKDLKYKAESILKSTQVTGQELLSLTGLSRNMSEYAQQLVTSVDVFKLEDQQAQTDAANQN